MQPRGCRHRHLAKRRRMDFKHARPLVCCPRLTPCPSASFRIRGVELRRQSTNVCDCSWTAPFPSFICSCLIFLPLHARSKTLLIISAEQKPSPWGCQHLSYRQHNPKASQSHGFCFEYACRLLDGGRKLVFFSTRRSGSCFQ